MASHPAGVKLTDAQHNLAQRIARFQHATSCPHRHPNGGESCGYCDLVGHYAVLTLLRHRAEVAEALGLRFKPFGFVWRPKPRSRRWVHRMTQEGRGFPEGAEFVDVFRLADGVDESTEAFAAYLRVDAELMNGTDPTTATDEAVIDGLERVEDAAHHLRIKGQVITGEHEAVSGDG